VHSASIASALLRLNFAADVSANPVPLIHDIASHYYDAENRLHITITEMADSILYGSLG
jgi:hypothetical protein